MAERFDDPREGGDHPAAGITGRDADDVEVTEVETAVIRAEIRETRERLGDTIEEIGERLNPRNIKEQVKQNVRDATIGRVENMAHSAVDRVDETRRTITDTIRENPIPAAMVGIGLGWMFINARNQASRQRYTGEYERVYGRAAGAESGYGTGRGYATGGYASTGYGTGSYASGGYGGGYAGGQYATGIVDDSEPGTVERVKERAGEVGETVKEKAGELAGRAQETVGRVADRAQHLAGNVAQETRYRARRVEDKFYESPLAIGAAALALGVAAGLAVPRTEKEVELMGGARDQIVDRVKEVAEDTKEKVQHVAGRVIDEAQTTAKEAAREEGLTS